MKENKLKLKFLTLQEKDIDKILKLEKEQNISILSKNTILNEINSPTSKYYVVHYNSLIVGYINIAILVDTIDINSIVVKQEYKQMGIATYMLNKILNLCKKLNITRILLEVRKSNFPAQNLYKKFGFKKIHTREKYYKNNLEDAYIYELVI